MLNRDGYAALTDIYDAAINLGRWRRALDGVAKVAEAEAIAMLIRNPDPGAKDLNMLNTKYLKFTRTAGGVYYGLRYARLQNPDWDYLARQPSQTPTPDTGIGPTPEELDSRADYAFLRKKLGVRRRLGIKLNSDKMWFDAMSVAFGANRQQIPDAAVANILPLLPHMKKSVEIGRTFVMLKSRYSAVLSALDRVKVGLAIAVPGGEIVVTNEEADRIFSLADGVVKDREGYLLCTDGDQTRQIKTGVARASDTARGEADFPENLMAVRRKSGAEPFLLDIAPLKDTSRETDHDLEGALITIIDPQRIPHPRMDRFVVLYDLTTAEADVLSWIIKGYSTEEIAEQRSTTPVTTKNQIASILDKTGVKRRAELIRLVIRVLPPVE